MKLPIIGVNRLRMATDGEGVTALVGIYGCPLRCPMCINPYAWQSNRYVEWVSQEQLYEKVKSDWLYYVATGGGITFGGGEPMLHMPFIKAFKNMYGQEIKVCVETSLNVAPELVYLSKDSIDTYIIDIKDMNPHIYQNYTGLTNERVIHNLNYLLSHVNPEKLQVKVPLIAEYNTKEDVKSSMQILRNMGVLVINELTYV